MRFLHAADLHLGKSIYGTSLIDSGDQTVWAERFLETALALKPDAVVMAGDVYDRGQPPGKATRLLSRMVTELAKNGIAVMMTAGNHDSVHHLSFLSPLLAESRVYISAPLENTTETVHVTLEDEHGPVTFWLLPYVYPAMICQALGDDGIRDYQTAIRRILTAQNINFSQRNVLVAHQNVTANGQEAERGGSESMVGGIGQVDYSVFDGFDYVALGHIHSSYPVGRETVRYAGSPLVYHFNEIRQPAKGPLLVTLGEKGGEIRMERQEIPPLHRMREIRGTYEEIRTEALAKPWEKEYLKIVLTDTRITPEISDFLHGIARAHESSVMELTSDYRMFTGDASAKGAKEMRDKPVEELFADFYKERNGGIDPTAEDLELLSFAGELTRASELGADAAEKAKREEKDQNARKILDYILKQEAAQQ